MTVLVVLDSQSSIRSNVSSRSNASIDNQLLTTRHTAPVQMLETEQQKNAKCSIKMAPKIMVVDRQLRVRTHVPRMSTQ